MVNRKKVGLTLAIVATGVKLLWTLLVGILGAGQMQAFIQWVAKMHSVQTTCTVLPINRGNALLMLVITFVVAFVVGSVTAILRNYLGKCFVRKLK